MNLKRYAALFLFVVAIGLVSAFENYMDYGEETADKTPQENIDTLLRLLSQRRVLENSGLLGWPLDHLMIRKSQRSPSLRLRFGRSGPHISAGALMRPANAKAAAAAAAAATGYDDNN